MNKKILLSSAITLTLTTQANAAGSYFDARNDAMGGVGVASSNYGTAALINPALLAKPEENDNITITIPSVGVQATDKDKIIDKLDDVSDAYESALGFNPEDIKADLAAFKKTLEEIDGSSADLNIGANLVIAVPNKYVNAALVANAYGSVTASAEVSQRDLDSLQAMIDGDDIVDIHLLESEARAVAALVQDYGLSLAKTYDIKGYDVHFGVTPKFQKVDTFNYSARIEQFDKNDIDAKEFRDSDTGFNADLGVAIDAHNLTYGLSARNVVSRNIETKTMNGNNYTYKISPLVTAGVAYRGKFATLSADADLTETKGFTHIKNSQYAGIGLELDAWKWAQLRAGYRADMKSERPDLVTAGIGLSPFNLLHIDVAGMIGSDKSAGAAVSVKFTL